MKWITTMILCIFAATASATVDGFPALYDITGVAADDALNVRNAPDASSAIIASYPPTAKNIEVIGLNDAETWGLVNVDGTSGWVSMQYMARHPMQYAGNIPNLTRCFGTEPFWGLEFTQGTVAFSSPDDSGSAVPYSALQSSNRIDKFAFVANGMTALVSERTCSDGMSDSTFGLSVELVAPRYGNMQLFSGCCTIQP